MAEQQYILRVYGHEEHRVEIANFSEASADAKEFAIKTADDMFYVLIQTSVPNDEVHDVDSCKVFNNPKSFKDEWMKTAGWYACQSIGFRAVNQSSYSQFLYDDETTLSHVSAHAFRKESTGWVESPEDVMKAFSESSDEIDYQYDCSNDTISSEVRFTDADTEFNHYVLIGSHEKHNVTIVPADKINRVNRRIYKKILPIFISDETLIICFIIRSSRSDSDVDWSWGGLDHSENDSKYDVFNDDWLKMTGLECSRLSPGWSIVCDDDIFSVYDNHGTLRVQLTPHIISREEDDGRWRSQAIEDSFCGPCDQLLPRTVYENENVVYM